MCIRDRAYLVAATWSEGLVTSEEMALESFTQLLLDDVGPDLVIEGLHHLVLWKLGEVLHGTELTVKDQGLASGIGLDEADTGTAGSRADLCQSCKLRVVHGVVLGELEHDRFLRTIKQRLCIVSRVDLTEGSFIELLGDDVAVVKLEALHLLDDWDGAVLLATYL